VLRSRTTSGARSVGAQTRSSARASTSASAMSPSSRRPSASTRPSASIFSPTVDLAHPWTSTGAAAAIAMAMGRALPGESATTASALPGARPTWHVRRAMAGRLAGGRECPSGAVPSGIPRNVPMSETGGSRVPRAAGVHHIVSEGRHGTSAHGCSLMIEPPATARRDAVLDAGRSRMDHRTVGVRAIHLSYTWRVF
jgi:hypothetical protein